MQVNWIKLMKLKQIRYRNAQSDQLIERIDTDNPQIKKIMSKLLCY